MVDERYSDPKMSFQEIYGPLGILEEGKVTFWYIDVDFILEDWIDELNGAKFWMMNQGVKLLVDEMPNDLLFRLFFEILHFDQEGHLRKIYALIIKLLLIFLQYVI